jgi:hypothetical protein
MIPGPNIRIYTMLFVCIPNLPFPGVPLCLSFLVWEDMTGRAVLVNMNRVRDILSANATLRRLECLEVKIY